MYQVHAAFKSIRQKFQKENPDCDILVFYDRNGSKEERKPEDDNQKLRIVEVSIRNFWRTKLTFTWRHSSNNDN